MLNDSITGWRRHIHQYPELGYGENATAAFVAGKLKSFGLEVRTGIAKTGVVAILKGNKPGPVIAMCAELDAVPITETATVPFASKVTTEYNGQMVGVSHACGHDVNVAVLLGTAKVLADLKKEYSGTVVFIFQPAEEGLAEDVMGGAKAMVAEGVLDDPKVDVIFGQHTFPQLEVGQIKYKSGAMFASNDKFTIKITGKATHGAKPWGGTDPIVISAQVIQGLQNIISRQTELVKTPAVLTIGSIHSGKQYNMVPQEAEMTGTVRALDEKTRLGILERIKRTATLIAESAGAVAEVTIEDKARITYNTPKLADQALLSLEMVAGKGNVSQRDWVTGVEDFSYFGEKVPSFYFLTGGMPKGQDPKQAPATHDPDFYIDESGMELGVKAFCQLAIDYARNYNTNK